MEHRPTVSDRRILKNVETIIPDEVSPERDPINTHREQDQDREKDSFMIGNCIHGLTLQHFEKGVTS